MSFLEGPERSYHNSLIQTTNLICSFSIITKVHPMWIFDFFGFLLQILLCIIHHVDQEEQCMFQRDWMCQLCWIMYLLLLPLLDKIISVYWFVHIISVFWIILHFKTSKNVLFYRLIFLPSSVTLFLFNFFSSVSCFPFRNVIFVDSCVSLRGWFIPHRL